MSLGHSPNSHRPERGASVGGSIGGRKYLSKDPVGYAAQALDVALREVGGVPPKLIFQDPSLSIHEYAPAVASLQEKRDRLAVIESLLKPAKANPEFRAYISTKLPALLSLLSPGDRISILNLVLADPGWRSPKARAGVAFAVVRSARDFSEMKILVSQRRAPVLLKLPHKELRELTAKTVIMRAFGRLQIPKGLSQEYSARVVADPREARRKVKAKLLEIHYSVAEHLKVLEAHRDLATLRSAREFRRSLKDARRILQPYISVNGRAPERRISRFHGAKFASFLSEKLRTELSYGVWLTRRTLPTGGRTRKWTAREARHVRDDLKLVGQGHLLMTPLLHKFERYTSPAWGERHCSGVIRLSDLGRINRNLSRDCAGIRVSRVVLLHELGHALQLGASVEATSWSKAGEFRQPADPLFDFPAFCRLSGWRVITQPWQLEHNRNAVRIDEALYPLRRPIMLDGELMTLCLAEYPPEPTFLMAYRSESSFPLAGANFRADPFEWWADGFMEYLILPERLAEVAPELFLYFHLHFRKYPEESELIQGLYQRLRAEAP